MPGLTDGHTHLFQTLGRGMGDGLSLVPWLRRFMFPYAKTITGEIAAAGAQLGALQAALSGTTMVVDNHYGPTDTETTLAVADSIESVGIRGAVARGIFGDPNRGGEIMGVAPELFPWSNDEELTITRECMDARPSGSQVEVWPGPENIVYVTPEKNLEILRWLRDQPDHRYDLLRDVTGVDYGGGQPLHLDAHQGGGNG